MNSKLIANIAQSIQIKGLTAPELSLCRQFYKVYPKILGSTTQELIRKSSIHKNIPL